MSLHPLKQMLERRRNGEAVGIPSYCSANELVLEQVLREALFALSMIEREIVPEAEQAHLIETLERVMLENPGNWQKHYHGSDAQLALARKYSFSDRARYYIGQPEVVASMGQLFANLRTHRIPLNMLHQYMPLSCEKVRDGKLSLDPRELALDGIQLFVRDYEFAVGSLLA